MLKERFNVISKLFMALMIYIITTTNLHAAEGTYYEIRSEKGVGYLIGSMHVGVASLYPVDAKLEDLVRKAKILALEAPVHPTKEWNDALVSNVEMQDGQDFFDTISPSIFDKAKRILVKQSKLNPAVIEALPKFHPFVTYQLLGGVIPRDASLGEFPSMDSYLDSVASQSNVKIVTLEDPINLINSIKRLSKDEVDILISGVFSLIEDDGIRQKNLELINKVAKFVKDGRYEDVKAASAAFNTEFLHWTPGMLNKIYYGRNLGLAKNIINLLDGGETFVVLVGASHLPGDTGMIELLKKSGYSVYKR